jgi:hypothetical protein
VEELAGVFEEVEEATRILEWRGLGLCFPTEDMLVRNWSAQAEPDEYLEVRYCYQRGLEWAEGARDKTRERGRFYVDYWVYRLQFGVDWMHTIEEVRRAAGAEAEGKLATALTCAERALSFAVRAAEAYTRAVRNQSDRASVALINEYGIKMLRTRIEGLRSQRAE